MTVQELAAFLAAPFEGDGLREVLDVASVDLAGAADVAFVSGRKAQEMAASTAAGCLLVPQDFENGGAQTVIRVREPRAAFAQVIARLKPPKRPTPGIHPSAVIASTAIVGANVSAGPKVVIQDGARIGDRCVIEAGSVIGANVSLGEDCHLHGNVTIYAEVEIGPRAIIHSGAVIGADGFGFVMQAGRYHKFPQVGRVVIAADVEIGANTCIDRAALGVTEIGEGTKLDNMVHIAHNCKIGKHVVIAAQTGLSGGVTVGDYAVVGGQVGVGDKARIESKAVIGSGAGILTSKIVKGGQVVWGTPARPLKEYLEQLAIMARLPEIRDELKVLRKKIEGQG